MTGIEYARMKQVADWQLICTGTTVRIMALNRSPDAAIAKLFGPEIGGRIKQINDQRDAIRTWATSDEENASQAKAYYDLIDEFAAMQQTKMLQRMAELQAKNWTQWWTAALSPRPSRVGFQGLDGRRALRSSLMLRAMPIA